MIFRNMLAPQNRHTSDHKLQSDAKTSPESAQHMEYRFHQQRVERILDRIIIYRNSRLEPFYRGQHRSVIVWPDGKEVEASFTKYITSNLDFSLFGFSLEQFYSLPESKRNEYLTEAKNLHHTIFSEVSSEKNFLKQAYRFYTELAVISSEYLQDKISP